MKKLTFIVLIILLSSCSPKVEISSELGQMTEVYALSNDDNKIELVSVVYEISNEVDLFELYTIYQNYLPEGYHSCASPNMTLISSSIQQNNIYYEVDHFILSSSCETLQEILLDTGKLYGYDEVHFIYNQQELI